MTTGDAAAYGVFFAAWLGYTYFADHSRWRPNSISAAIERQRMRWMEVAATREQRIVDSSILGNLLTGISFFASTTMLVIGGLMAGFGSYDQAALAIDRLPGSMPLSAEDYALKMSLLLAIFIYAFFKFAWAFRLCNYCSIVVGAMPLPGREPPAVVKRQVEKAAKLSTLSAHHFNRGLRAYFYALAALGSFVHPVLLIAMTVAVTTVLFRREFASRALKSIVAEP